MCLSWRQSHGGVSDYRYEKSQSTAHTFCTPNANFLLLHSDISICAPIVAPTVFGWSLHIFMTTHIYDIFLYLQYAASALRIAFCRYAISAALCLASIKLYENLGAH
ncbi:hypothetical protein BJX76DRAFT_340640 [Aspergillus varians]